MVVASELVASGGPSAPVWAFFTAISLALIAILGQQLKARTDLRKTRDEASKASESAAAAQENTVNVSNGFVGRMDRKLDRIEEAVADTNASLQDTQRALREHLDWHLRERKN